MYSQGIQKFKNYDSSGKPISEYVTTASPLPVDATMSMDSLSLSKIAQESSLLVSLSYLHPLDKWITAIDSVSTDTVNIDVSSLTTYGHLTISAKDSIQISLNNISWYSIEPNATLSINNFSPITFQNIYIKRESVTGTAHFTYIVLGY
jgi:hypothetical protein